MRKTWLFIAFGLTSLTASAAEAKQWKYIGAHPVASDRFCYIEAPHVHVTAPHKKVLFRVYDDHYYFVGDPVAYGWDGPRHTYHGHHPIQVDVIVGHHGTEFCYLDGPHYHFFAPRSDKRFVVKGGVYWYVGKMPGRYKREREIYGPINHVYAEVQYRRPVVTIAPPVGYVDFYVSAPVPRVRGHVSVVAPRPHVPVIVPPRPHVGVFVPSPSVTVRHESRVVVEHRNSPGRGKKRGHHKHGKRGRR